MNTSKYTWVYLYTRGKPEEASEMAEPISAAYMHCPHSTFTLSMLYCVQHRPWHYQKVATRHAFCPKCGTRSLVSSCLGSMVRNKPKTREQTQNSETRNRGVGVEHLCVWNVRNKPKTYTITGVPPSLSTFKFGMFPLDPLYTRRVPPRDSDINWADS